MTLVNTNLHTLLMPHHWWQIWCTSSRNCPEVEQPWGCSVWGAAKAPLPQFNCM
jgi:hypothetical protein